MVFSMRLKYGERILKHGESTFKHEWRYGGMIFKHGELRWKHYHGMVMSTVLGLRLILYIHATSLPLRSPRQETQPKTLPRRRRWRSPDLSLPLWLYLAIMIPQNVVSQSWCFWHRYIEVRLYLPSKSDGEWGILRDVTSSSISSRKFLPITHDSRDSDSLFLCCGLFWILNRSSMLKESTFCLGCLVDETRVGQLSCIKDMMILRSYGSNPARTTTTKSTLISPGVNSTKR